MIGAPPTGGLVLAVRSNLAHREGYPGRTLCGKATRGPLDAPRAQCVRCIHRAAGLIGSDLEAAQAQARNARDLAAREPAA